MPNYNIYLKSDVTGHAGENEATTKVGKKTKDEGKVSKEVTTEAKIQRITGFITNPDSALSFAKQSLIKSSGVMETGSVTSIATVALKAAFAIADKTINVYNSFAVPASGNANFQKQWSNIKRSLQIVKNPIQTAYDALLTTERQYIENLRREENSILLGGTILGSEYGRFL